MTSIVSFFRRGRRTPAIDIQFPYTADTNPYHAKRSWPPNFEHLSNKHQFRLERRYRRRTSLKWARPTWNKAVQLTQWSIILMVGVYGVMFMDTGRGASVFDEVRGWYKEQVETFEDARNGGVKTEERTKSK